MLVTGILESIKPQVAQTTGLTGEFVDDVDLRLQSLGYTLQASDAWLVAFEIQTAAMRIKNECNVVAVPDGLIHAAVNMICGLFLEGKKGSGQLDGFNVDVDTAAIKQTQSGDTNVVFAVEKTASHEQRLDAVIDYLINGGKFAFHRVGSDVRVLSDINSLVNVTLEKGEDFKQNQTIRVIDQIGNDIAVLFNTKYLGVVPNDADGRISLWSDIVSHHAVPGVIDVTNTKINGTASNLNLTAYQIAVFGGITV